MGKIIQGSENIVIRTAKDIWNNRHAIYSQFYVNIKVTVASTRLGILWWIFDPLLLMIIYYFVVKVIFDRGGPNYHLFALCGIVTWQSFARSIGICTNALISNIGLIKQASLPMVIYLIVPPVVQAFFYMIGLVIIMIWNFPSAGLHTLGVFILALLMIMMTFTAGLYLSIFEGYIRDTGKIVDYALRFGFFLSPILYSPDKIYDSQRIPDLAKTIYSLNPMVPFITAVRDLLLDGHMFNFPPIFITFAVTLFAMQLGLVFFRHMSPYIPKMI